MKRQAEIFDQWQRGSKEDPITKPVEKIKVYGLVYEVPVAVVEYLVDIQAAYEINYKEREKVIEHWQGKKDYNILKEIEKYAERKEKEFRKSAIMCFEDRHINSHGYDYCYRGFLDYKHGALAWYGVRQTIDILKIKNLNQ